MDAVQERSVGKEVSVLHRLAADGATKVVPLEAFQDGATFEGVAMYCHERELHEVASDGAKKVGWGSRVIVHDVGRSCDA